MFIHFKPKSLNSYMQLAGIIREEYHTRWCMFILALFSRMMPCWTWLGLTWFSIGFCYWKLFFSHVHCEWVYRPVLFGSSDFKVILVKSLSWCSKLFMFISARMKYLVLVITCKKENKELRDQRLWSQLFSHCHISNIWHQRATG